MQRVLYLYCLSGFISLGYQVTWFRIFVDWFGSTNLTFALVISNFVGGLGCGALLSDRICRLLSQHIGIKDKLRLYGLLELFVGISALLTVAAELLPADLWGSFPYRLSDGIWVQAVPYQIAQVTLAMLCVLVPCLFMGVTFPLLCDVFRTASGRTGARFPSTLYAWNTLGACAGILACQFVLILWVGHQPTFWLMASMNILLGSYFLVRGRAPATDSSAHVAGATEPEREETASQLSSDSVLIACAVLSGLLAGALQGDMFKRIGFIIVLSPGAMMSFISFWAVLGIFLASSIVRGAPWLRLWHIKLAYVLAACYYGVVWRYGDELTYLLSHRPATGEAHHFPVSLAQLFVYCGIFVLPSYLLTALLFPYVCNRLQSRGRHLGRVYGLNTVAFCIGLLVFTLVAPSANIFYSLKLFLAVLASLTVGLVCLSESRPLRAWQPLGVAGLLGIAGLFTPRTFDAEFFTPSMWPHVTSPEGLRSDAAHTTYVLTLPDHNKKLFFGRLSMSGTSRESQQYMRLMAHFPLLAHPHPRRALLICFGVGNTASAIAAHESIQQIDAIDLVENVFRTAPEFWSYHGNVHLDPRLRMINDDGRNFLNLSHESYDLITSEPPPPMAGGVYRLYSKQFYEQVLAHLTPEGLMTHWLPWAQMPPVAAELVTRTFIEVFPHSLLLRGAGSHLILVGSRSPIDLRRIAARFHESERVQADLRRLGIWDAPGLLESVISTGEALRDQLGPGRVLSDQHNNLEHMFYDPLVVSSLPGRVSPTDRR